MVVPRTRAVFRSKRKRRFDGNRTDDVHEWLFATLDFQDDTAKWMRELMEHSVDGNIAWVIFPPEGFRL